MSTLPTADTVLLQAGPAPQLEVADGGPPLLVCLPSMPADRTASMLGELARTFPGQRLIVASPEQPRELPEGDGLVQLVPYAEPRSEGEWVLTSSDYFTVARLAEERGAAGVLLLGTEAQSLEPHVLEAMRASLAAGADLALPRYHSGPNEGLVNSALLYPLTRALFGADVRFPLPLDAGLSPRLLARLAAAARRPGAQADDGLLWPVAEASIAGFAVREVDGGHRLLPAPQELDLHALFPLVTSSLFGDLESKASYWQRARALGTRNARGTTPRPGVPALPEVGEEVRSLAENFRLAFTNLREIWSLVLPPQSLLALKKLSASAPESFHFAPDLWARTAYDFALAFHLRTLNRGHLLGAFTPLYLGWVASYLRSSNGDAQASAELLEATANAFEQEKPYLVSRWRWPDRFNP